MRNTYLATAEKKKFVQEQCNVCPILEKDNLFLVIILDTVYSISLETTLKPLARLRTCSLEIFLIKGGCTDCMMLKSGPGYCVRSSAYPIISTL